MFSAQGKCFDVAVDHGFLTSLDFWLELRI